MALSILKYLSIIPSLVRRRQGVEKTSALCGLLYDALELSLDEWDCYDFVGITLVW
jgi:hypothetical protein